MKLSTFKTLIFLSIAAGLSASLMAFFLIQRAAETTPHLSLKLNTAIAILPKTPETTPDQIATLESSDAVVSGSDNQSVTPEKVSDFQEMSRLIEIKTSPYWEISKQPQVANATSWQSIFVQNKLKLEYTVSPQSSRDWELIQIRRKLKIRFRSEMDAMKDILSRKKRGKYAVQLLSLSEDEIPKAMQLLRLLLDDGHYAYLFRTRVRYEGKYWYRLRVGFFKNRDEAQKIGTEIGQKYASSNFFPKKYWTVFPSSRELSREIIDLQQPITKSWVIELPFYNSKTEAIQTVIRFSLHTDFTYISQKLNPENKRTQYRVRVGFFEEALQAKKKLRRLSKRYRSFRRASVVRL